MVWMLWSIKESVYKAYQRINYNEGFYPTKIKILKFDDQYESIIKLFATYFYGKTFIDKNFIHTVALLNQSDLNRIQNMKISNYNKNEKGLPVQLHSNNPISVSHHGNIKKVVGLF